jgi:hypothetical protein
MANPLTIASDAAKTAEDLGTLSKDINKWLSDNAWAMAGGLIALIALILFILWYTGFIFKTPPKATATTTAAALGTAAANAPSLAGSSVSGFESGPGLTEGFQPKREGFQPNREGFQASQPTVPPQEISPEETTFLNLQPMAIKDTGFFGPYPNGAYDAVTATGNVLKAGFRFLTLQIDYMDSVKDGDFALPGEPTLLMRASNGGLLTSNTGSIKDVATTVANMAFRPEVPNNTQPVILYLHVNRAPNPVREPNSYVLFLSKIAEALNPLAPFHLGLTPLGNFTRQKMANSLLTTPLSSLEGQVVILSNADTSLFRSTSASIDRYDPAKDLDFWVNMRVYLDSENDSLGITHAQEPNGPVHAVVADLKRLLSLSDSAATTFAAKAKNRYVIAMGDRITNPTVKEIDRAINTLGINVVPLDIFTPSTATIMDITSEYANMSYHPKPVALRTT